MEQQTAATAATAATPAESPTPPVAPHEHGAPGEGTPDDPKAVVEAYLQAAKDHDLDGCLSYFADDAKLSFMSGVFEGRRAIEEWHQERLKAEMRFVRIDSVKARGDVVTVDAVITSKRLKAFKIDSLGGRATFRLQQGKIKETSFGLRLQNPLEGW